VKQSASLTLVVITYNEAHYIADCIESAKDIVDEILVVDSFSTDKTVEIATALGATVLQHSFAGHIEQKNWAKDQVQSDYVLSLDADERLSEELKAQIELEKQAGFMFSGYYMNRLNYIGQHAIKGCGWYPDKKMRLWNRKQGVWMGINPHDRFRLKSGFPKTHLKGDIIHFSYKNRKELYQKSIRYGIIGAEHAKSLDIFTLLFKVSISPLFKFFRNYFLKGGIVYGIDGLSICFCQLIESYIKYSRGLALKFKR
jgi:glycosyltransferase involved in cell wall biosynthesis